MINQLPKLAAIDFERSIKFTEWTDEQHNSILLATLQSLGEQTIIDAIVETFGPDYAAHEFAEKLQMEG